MLASTAWAADEIAASATSTRPVHVRALGRRHACVAGSGPRVASDAAATGPGDNGRMHEPDDPRPLAPEPPLPNECCDSGCDPCVYDLHAEAMDKYRRKLAKWRARHPEADT
jgi:hypothetical protein